VARTSVSWLATSPTFDYLSRPWLRRWRRFRKALLKGEIISTIAIAATQVMITASAWMGAMFVTAIVSLLPLLVVAAVDWLLPSIWGAIVVQFGMRNWRYAVVAVIASIVVVIYSGLPSWSHTPILVVLMVAMALFTHNRGIWVRKDRESEELPAAGAGTRPRIQVS
jgi:hypothetical protein